MECIELISRIFSIFADVAVVVGAPISIIQLIRIQRQRKEEQARNVCKETMDYWDQINADVRELKDAILHGLNLDVDCMLEKGELPQSATNWNYNLVTKNKDLHQCVKKYLSIMERLSVGIRFHRYDIEVFDRLYGHTTIRMHDVLTPYLKHIKEKKGGFFYGDFETMVEQLKRVRKARFDTPDR